MKDTMILNVIPTANNNIKLSIVTDGNVEVEFNDETQFISGDVVLTVEESITLRISVTNGEYMTLATTMTCAGSVEVVQFHGSIPNQRFYFKGVFLTVPSVLPRHMTVLTNMFANSHVFNQDISTWDVSNVTDMSTMFINCMAFNQDISNWNVSRVTTMQGMFYRCKSFNQPLNDWDVSSVVNMVGLFKYCTSFNQPLNDWDISNVKDMEYMFYACESLQQDLSEWTINAHTKTSNMLLNCPTTLSCV